MKVAYTTGVSEQVAASYIIDNVSRLTLTSPEVMAIVKNDIDIRDKGNPHGAAGLNQMKKELEKSQSDILMEKETEIENNMTEEPARLMIDKNAMRRTVEASIIQQRFTDSKLKSLTSKEFHQKFTDIVDYRLSLLETRSHEQVKQWEREKNAITFKMKRKDAPKK